MGRGIFAVVTIGSWITMGCDGGGTLQTDEAGVTPDPIEDAGTIMDSSTPPPMDAGPPPPIDATPPPPEDTGPTEPVCNPESGIECDGDWSGRCGDGCADGECCTPLGGSFQCVARNSEGVCPAADIWVDEERLERSVMVEWKYFSEADCALVEGCVTQPGWRRLLRFSTWTPNTGTADLFLGAPSEASSYFNFSSCHNHYHFDSYAQYYLNDLGGSVVATGHKQAFCLLDFYRYPEEDDRGAVYTCDYQGIQAGYQDVYSRSLDCQWVDVTDVPAGDYQLAINLNTEQMLLESDYTNNAASITVNLPPVADETDVTLPCPDGTERSSERNCGLVKDPNPHTCTPGEIIEVSCSSACGLGTCSGDPFMRVCDDDVAHPCMAHYSLGINDDSGCGGGRCGRGGDCCPRVEFTCPPSGDYVVYWDAFDLDGTATCTVGANVIP